MARSVRGVSQAEMARATGLSLASWRRFEAGLRPASLEVWVNAAIALGLHFEDLVGEERLTTWHPTRDYPYPPNPSAFQRSDAEYQDVIDMLDGFEDFQRMSRQR